jgi:diguanylate cyclase (GGDEF)-like protein
MASFVAQSETYPPGSESSKTGRASGPTGLERSMPPALLPSTEADRLAALRSYEVLDTASEEAFDDIVALAARLTGSPCSVVSLIDAGRGWFKARYGLMGSETRRDIAFCAHAILDPSRPLVVADATKDPRFADNPMVTGARAIRAYLGVPLVNPEGYALGTLCVIDLVPRLYDEGTVQVVQTLARAVTVNLELRRALLRAREMALTDALTGLPNRRAIMIALSEALVTGADIAVISVDLDHFKEANDTEGHAAGDALLRAVADRLKDSVRPGDFVGRIGGDEFVAILVGVADQDIVTEIARRISATLHRPVAHGTKLLRLGATLGVAVAPADAKEPEMVMRVADEAMVRAKRDCRGTIGRAKLQDAARLARTAAIVRAFDADDVEGAVVGGALVHFQPIVSLGRLGAAGGEVVAVEALARWAHPDEGVIPPDELFPMIGPERAIRLWWTVREQALWAFVLLRREGLIGGRLALNLSAAEVSRPDIVPRVAEQIDRAGLSLRNLELEINEDVLLDRVSDRTRDQLAALRGHGARLVLDDFGTGHSGLMQLLRLPLDGVKLDKRFIQRLGIDPRADEIVGAALSGAHVHGFAVVAEGVETEQQVAMLRALGCDSVQGFLIGRPMAPDTLKTWLQDRVLDNPPGVIRLRPKKTRVSG